MSNSYSMTKAFFRLRALPGVHSTKSALARAGHDHQLLTPLYHKRSPAGPSTVGRARVTFMNLPLEMRRARWTSSTPSTRKDRSAPRTRSGCARKASIAGRDRGSDQIGHANPHPSPSRKAPTAFIRRSPGAVGHERNPIAASRLAPWTVRAAPSLLGSLKSRGGERRGNAGTMIPAGMVERGERKQTASEVSKAD
jgi:hypothetical protein